MPGAIAGAFYILVLTQLLQQFNFNPTGLIRIGDHFDGVDVEVHGGGQPLYPYLFGVE